jgi:hypothetical protein
MAIKILDDLRYSIFTVFGHKKREWKFIRSYLYGLDIQAEVRQEYFKTYYELQGSNDIKAILMKYLSYIFAAIQIILVFILSQVVWRYWHEEVLLLFFIYDTLLIWILLEFLISKVNQRYVKSRVVFEQNRCNFFKDIYLNNSMDNADRVFNRLQIKITRCKFIFKSFCDIFYFGYKTLKYSNDSGKTVKYISYKTIKEQIELFNDKVKSYSEQKNQWKEFYYITERYKKAVLDLPEVAIKNYFTIIVLSYLYVIAVVLFFIAIFFSQVIIASLSISFIVSFVLWQIKFKNKLSYLHNAYSFLITSDLLIQNNKILQCTAETQNKQILEDTQSSHDESKKDDNLIKFGENCEKLFADEIIEYMKIYKNKDIALNKISNDSVEKDKNKYFKLIFKGFFTLIVFMSLIVSPKLIFNNVFLPNLDEINNLKRERSCVCCLLDLFSKNTSNSLKSFEGSSELNEIINKYPELKEVNIRIEHDELNSTMVAQPVFNIDVFCSSKRDYVIIINNNPKNGKFLLSDMDVNIQVGWFAHELNHIVDYNNKSLYELIYFGLNYALFDSFKKETEKRIDIATIHKGFGLQLLAGVELSWESDKLDSDYKNKLKTLYMSPDELKAIISNYEKTNNK